jgi:integrase/recombinase XerD
MSMLAPVLQAFFTVRLTSQHQASPHTIAAYRDTMRLLLKFAHERTGKQPSNLDLQDLDAPLIGAFLEHLERERANSVRTRNARLAAIHSLFRYAALSHPEHAALIARVLAIPAKRFDRAIVTHLSEAETGALLDAPDRGTWTGRRDHALLHLALQTGLRTSELTSLNCGDIHLGQGPHASSMGKGRKERCTPLTTETVAVLRSWLSERGGGPSDPVFPTSRGRALSADALEHRLAKHAALATHTAPALASKKITMHVLRHTAAMRLLRAGADISVIALWLGHESSETTQIYLHADLVLKEQALARTTPADSAPGRYRPPDATLAFLQSLG